MKVKLLLASLCLGAGSLALAQDASTTFGGPVKGPLVGFAVNLTDYRTDLPYFQKGNLGASLFFWSGITKKLDYSIRLNGLFSDYALPQITESTKLISELEGSLHLKALNDNHFINPFLSAGIGAGRYSNSFVPYVPVGVGVQFNVYSESYVFLQANYRFTLKDTKLDDNMFFSMGFAVPLRAKRAVAPEPVAAQPLPADRDGDGVADANDECPDLAGSAALHGCPDKDNDGIADKYDKCPDVAGTAKYQGCPVPDTDGDGINDEMDKCPNIKGVASYQGCPVPDADADGVADDVDKCPNVAGPASNKGCPEVKAEVKEKLAFAAKSIQFETGKSIVKKQSYEMLDAVVGILNQYPDYNMSVDGYTDNVGNAAKNVMLSQQRSDAVKAYFVGKGINSGRIKATGHGIENPKADNKTAAGRVQNRRVEMDLHLKE